MQPCGLQAVFCFQLKIKFILEMYADDCSIFLSPDEDSLRSTMRCLDLFFRISGLRISISKTKAIWIGAGCNFSHRLCPELQLQWDSEFRLLGIDFDNSLQSMDRNFEVKHKQIKKSSKQLALQKVNSIWKNCNN